MKRARAWTTPLTGGALRTPLESAVFHREHAQPVAAEIGREQMAAASVEEQRMGMRGCLRLGIRSATCLLENAARLAQAAVLCNGKEVVNCAAVSGHGEQLSVR